jgi:hypothetical protein
MSRGYSMDHDVAASRVERRTGWWGLGFVLLLLVSAGMASVPGGQDATSVVRAFYVDNSSVIVVAQIVGLAAALWFVPFALLLRGSSSKAERGAPEWAGLAVAAAAVVTAVPVLWLSVVADTASDDLVHGLAVASDLADVLLFAAIGVFGAALSRASASTWFTVLAALVALLALGRAVLIILGSSALELTAPMAFVVLVLVLSGLALTRRSPLHRL